MAASDAARAVLTRTLGPARARALTAAAVERLRDLYPDTAPPATRTAGPQPATTQRPEAEPTRIDPDARRINIGGGRWRHPGWENVDHYVSGPEVHYNVDLRLDQRLPLPDGSCQLLFTSHILEHMDDAAAAAVLREARRLLAPGGTFRISVPDARRAIEAYEGGDELFFTKGGVNCLGPTIEHKLVNFFASYRHGDYSGGPLVRPYQVRAALADHDLYGFIEWCVAQIPDEAGYQAHVNGYDYPKLAAMLHAAGFDVVSRSAWRTSQVPDMRHENFDNRPIVSLFVECAWNPPT